MQDLIKRMETAIDIARSSQSLGILTHKSPGNLGDRLRVAEVCYDAEQHLENVREVVFPGDKPNLFVRLLFPEYAKKKTTPDSVHTTGYLGDRFKISIVTNSFFGYSHMFVVDDLKKRPRWAESIGIYDSEISY